MQLKTGHQHQIRAILAHEGHPLVGDPLYGKDTWVDARVGRLMLHSWRLAVPSGEVTVDAVAPIPHEFNAFLKDSEHPVRPQPPFQWNAAADVQKPRNSSNVDS